MARRPLTPPKDPYNFDESDKSNEDMPKKKKKNDQQRATLTQGEERFNMDRRDLPLHPFWDVIPRDGFYERDNTLRDILSGHFYVSRQTNAVYHHCHHTAAIAMDQKGQNINQRTLHAEEANRVTP